MRSSSEVAAEVRPARFDRPLSGAASAMVGAGWGDPRLDATLAEAVDEGRRRGMAEGYAAGWAAGLRAAAEQEQTASVARAQAAEAERRQRLARAGALLEALAQATHDTATAST